MPRMYAWSKAGRAKTYFGIHRVTGEGIEVKTEKGTIRFVPRSDFEKVFSLWADYKEGKVLRKELRSLVVNSVYVLGVLHWLELQ